jgi:hypothetical protein
MPSTENKYAPKSWAEAEFEFKLPSGDLCLLRKMDPLSLGEHGLLDKLDFATSVVMNTHAKNASLTPVQRVQRERAKRAGEDPDEPNLDEVSMKEIMKNAENSRSFREVMDQLMVLGVVAPEMHLPPGKGEERVAGLYYTDAVPFSDKMAVFNKLMEGVRTAEQFREEPEESVGDMAPEPSVRPAAKRAPRPRAKR